MSEQANWQGEDAHAPGLTAAMDGALAGAADGRPRIGADAFRALTARLKRPGATAPVVPAPAPVIPDLIVAPAPAALDVPALPVAEAMAEPALAPEAMPEPAFTPVEIAAPVFDPFAPLTPHPEAAPTMEMSGQSAADMSSSFAQPVLAPPPAILPPPEFSEPPVAVVPPEVAHLAQPYGPVHPAMDLHYAPPPPMPEPRLSERRTESRLRKNPKAAPATGEEKSRETAAATAELRRRATDGNTQLLKQIKMLVFSPPSLADRTAYLKEAAEIMAAEQAQQLAEAPADAVPPELSLDHIEPAVEAPPSEAGGGSDTSGPFDPATYEAAASGPAAAPLPDALPDIPPELALPQEVAPEAAPARAVPPARPEAEPAVSALAKMNEAEAVDLSRSLLDMMSASAGNALPQERVLAADTLLRLVPRLPLKARIMLADRIGIMEQPPHLLVSKLIRDSAIEVAGPLLENASQLTDQDLAQVIEENQNGKLRMVARRRHVSRAVSDQLIATRDGSVQLTLIRNGGAEISHDGFLALSAECELKPDLLAPLCTRPDLPAPTAFELFWLAPPQLRRYLISRFLTDSETLARILKITLASQGGDEPTEDRAQTAGAVQAAVAEIAAGRYDAGADRLAEVARINPATALRVLGDPQGEPMAVLLKAIASPRNDVTATLHHLQRGDHSTLMRGRDVGELQVLFDSLSFNKARMLLTYWDWAVLKTGPYAIAN